MTLLRNCENSPLSYFFMRVLHFLLLALSLSSCSFKNFQHQQGPTELKLALPSEPHSLDPAIGFDLTTGKVLYQIYETLYEYQYLKRPYKLTPLLASGYPLIENEGKKYTIKIRQDIFYHPHPCLHGRPREVRPQDFVNALKRLAFRPLKSNGLWLLKGVKGIAQFQKKVGDDFSKLLSNEIEGISVRAEQSELVIELDHPVPQFPYYLAMTHTSPIPLEVLTCTKNDLSTQEIGTGPYSLKDWRKQNSLQLEKFPQYRKIFYPHAGDRYANTKKLLANSGERLPFIDKIQFTILPSFEEQWKAFENHQLDLIELPNDLLEQKGIIDNSQFQLKARNGNYELDVSPSLKYWWLAFNMKDPLLGKNANLRRAISCALDRDLLLKVFTNNSGLNAYSFFPPGIFGHDPRGEMTYSYDLAQAKHFLKIAGYANGKNLPPLVFGTRDNDPSNIKKAQFIKEQLALIGIRVEIRVNDFKKFLREVDFIGNKKQSPFSSTPSTSKRPMQLWLGGWSLDFPDPTNTLSLLITQNFPPGGPNYSYYSNSQFDQLYEQVSQMIDSPSKKRTLKKMEKILMEDLPWVLLYYDRNYVLFHKNLKNFRHPDLVFNYIKYLKLTRP
jgi:oligopeptide transport system substrate-binding protein